MPGVRFEHQWTAQEYLDFLTKQGWRITRSREMAARMLNENGLRIWHHLQKKETVDPKDKLQSWNRLRGQMPAWEALHRKYGK